MSNNIYNIYIIRNRINSHSYVGRTIFPIEQRFRKHCTTAYTHPKGLLHAAILKYGEENFGVELLYTGNDPLLEDTFINQYGCEYNTRSSGVIPTEEYRAKCSSGNIGFIHSQETKDKISKTLKAKEKKYTIEERKELSARLTGIKKGPQSPEHLAKRVAARKATLTRMRLEKMREVS